MSRIAVDGAYQFDNDLNSTTDAIAGNGVVSGMAVTENDAGADMSVDVASGVYVANGTAVTYAGGNVVITAANGSNPRKDIIIGDSSGNITCVAGTAAAAAPVGNTGTQTYTPVPPDITTNKIILAEVWVGTGVTTIVTANITDRRVNINALVRTHASRHKLSAALGADPLEIKSLWMRDQTPIWFKNWESKGTWTTSADGTPGFVAGWEVGTLTTGGTSGNTAYIHAPTGIYVYNNSAGYYCQFRIRLWTTSAVAAAANEIWIGMFTNPTAPTTTERHIGFKMINSDWFATQGDGATNNVEDTTVNWAQNTTLDFYIRQIGTTVYYWTAAAGVWTLRNTLTTNTPSGTQLKPVVFLKTTENVVKTIYMYPMAVMLGAND